MTLIFGFDKTFNVAKRSILISMELESEFHHSMVETKSRIESDDIYFLVKKKQLLVLSRVGEVTLKM